ncbi:type I-F CRISPR-associated protein Csy2 [uncultured Massilia sp.]|uniref:type I-F CRISPR-associated protein Csy2 n=1 Tax=uncultured Massilia sp. TaxID=169973 RepID=UPI0025D2AB89|nr:type I-F CRISPR-associated protein Csy2 [uncultured Massilia sp.]
MSFETPTIPSVLVLPRLRIQNANAISSPLTWGFPAITAFTGLMTALERKLGRDASITMHGIGVICHGIEPQVTRNGYTRNFHLTRNPILPDGETAAIVEEGRAHLDLTLVIDVDVAPSLPGTDALQHLAQRIGTIVAGMRIAGGSVVPPLPGRFRRPPTPQLFVKESDPHEASRILRKLTRQWLPGFALVSRDDLLQQRFADLRLDAPAATLLDAFLDLSSLTHRAVLKNSADEDDAPTSNAVEWRTDARAGWIVPMPVGFARIAPLQAPGSVARVRDPSLPVAFVESVYSVGQWISPHRLVDIDHLFWQPYNDKENGLYRCINGFRATPTTAVSTY